MFRDDATFNQKIFAFHKSQTNLLYATFLCIGGLGFESKISVKVKIFYYIWQILCIIFGSTASLVWFYQLCKRQKPTFQQFFTFAISFNNPIAGLVADFIAYSFRNKIRFVLQQIDDDFNIEWKYTGGNVGDQKMPKNVFNVGGTVLLFFILGNALLVIFLCSRLIAIAFTGGMHINDIYYFLFAVPAVDKVDTMAKYMVINIFQIIMSAAILLKGLLIPLFFLSISGLLSNQFVLFTYALANESKRVQRVAETKYLKLTGNILGDVGQRFCDECIVYLKVFRHLMKITKSLQRYVEVSFLFSVAATFAYIVPICYMLRLPIPLSYKISSTAIMILLIFVFFIISYISKVFDEVNASVTFAVYDTPWYNLPARQQRFIHMFLCEAQQTKVKFNALKLYPISMNAFLRVLNINYSVLNILCKI